MIEPAMILPYIIAAAAAYLLGSISFSIIITKKFAGTDVRSHGSGNAGATNVLRTAGKLPAILTFACDFLKCVAAILFSVLIAHLFHLNGEFTQVIKYTAGIFCMLGHIFPVYFGFKGGKGVTTAAAVALLLDWRCFLIGIGIFLIIVLITRYVSLGSMLASASLPVSTYILTKTGDGSYALFNTALIAILAVIIIIKHRANIVRLIKGNESKLHIG